MPLSQAQKKIATDTHRFRVAVCGRRFGKSHIALRELARFASKPDSLVYYVAPTYRMAKQIIWKKLKKKMIELNWAKKINESDLTITLVNDSEISLRSSDNYDSLRGVGLNFVVLDEAADMESEVWHEVLRPTLSDKEGHALFLGTPKGMNWLKDIYDMAKTEPESWSSYQFTTLDGGQVPETELAAARRDLDEKTYRQEYEATFEQYSGIIYYAFGEHNIGDTPTPLPTDIILLGLDFNIDPISAVVGLRRGDHLYIFEEVVIQGANTQDLIDEVRRRWPTNRIEVYPDASGAQRRTSSNTTDHILLRNAGWTVKVRSTNPPVLDRIASLNSRFKTTSGQSFITINKTCKRLIKGLQGQVYKEGTRIPDKDSGMDHLNDAAGYLVHWLWPVRRDIDLPKQPRVFGHL